MKRLNFAIISDVVFYSLATGLLALCILRYFRLPVGIAFAAAALLALAAGGLVFLFSYGKSQKKYLTKQQKTKLDALSMHLALERPERVRAQMLAALLADGREANCYKDELSLDDNPLVLLFTMQPVSADLVARAIRDVGSRPFTIACNALSPESEALVKSFAITVLRSEDVFELFTRTDTFPDPLVCGSIPRVDAKQRFRRAFSKKNARPFFVSGLLLLVMSLFTLFPIYYLVTGAVLMATAVTVRILGYS